MKVMVNGIEIELTPEQEALVSPVAKEKARIVNPIDDKWIDCKDKMPDFYKDNVISNSVWAKGNDGKIIEDVGLYKSIDRVRSFGLTKEHYHPNIIQWQPLYDLGLIAILILLPLFSFAQYPKQIVYQGDSVIAITPTQLTDLNTQLVLFSRYVRTSDSTVAIQDSIIIDLKLNTDDLKQMIGNKDLEISALNKINKNNRKRNMKRIFYYTGAGLVTGLVAGIIIAK